MATIVQTLDMSTLEHKIDPPPHMGAGRSFTLSGYGRKIPTQHMVKLPGSPRWRRVYCCIYSNAGTCYVEQGNDWIVIH